MLKWLNSRKEIEINKRFYRWPDSADEYWKDSIERYIIVPTALTINPENKELLERLEEIFEENCSQWIEEIKAVQKEYQEDFLDKGISR